MLGIDLRLGHLRFGLPLPGHYTPSCLPGVDAGVAGVGSPPPGSTPPCTQGRAGAGHRAFGHAHFAGREEDGALACDEQSAQLLFNPVRIERPLGGLNRNPSGQVRLINQVPLPIV